MLQLRGVAKVQVAWPVRVPHGDLFPSVWAYVPPPVGVEVFSCLLVHILTKKGGKNYMLKIQGTAVREVKIL